MTIGEAREIAANPAAFPDHLRLARLKLIGKALRAFPSSPTQRAIQQQIRQIETMPEQLWKLEAVS